MLDVSVIICAHNPRSDYLRRVLEALRSQTLSIERWELLFVHNVSDERLVDAWDISWHTNARHISESRLGLAYARQCGIRQAVADILVFVDDDNVLESDYLSEVIKISRKWPRLGVWGSNSINAKFEVEPPSNMLAYLPYLALRDARVISWSNVPTCREALPCRAGLCIRANVAGNYLQVWEQSSIRAHGRKGTSLLSGEDQEIAQAACNMGFGMGLFPELRLLHLIPKERISEDYLIRLFEDCELTNFLLAYKWQGVPPLDPLTPYGLLAAVKNVFVRQRVKRRMYFALMRAANNARRIIVENQL